MNFISIGITHENTPIELREQLAVHSDDLQGLNQKLFKEKSILENLILTTCNRTEVFAVVDQVHTGKYYIKKFILDYFKLDKDLIEDYLEIYIGEVAIHRLLMMSVGLKSAIKGETQILGQLKNNYETAKSSGTTGIYLNHIFQQTFSFAKKIHTQFKLNDNPISISYEVFRQLKDEGVDEKNVLLISLGRIGQNMLQYLVELPFNQIYIANRTYSKSVKYAKADDRIKAVPFDQLNQAISDATYLITAADVIEPLLTDQDFDHGQVPSKIYDLGLPRNVVLEEKAIPVTNVDDLKITIKQNRDLTTDTYQAIKALAWEDVDGFYDWYNSLDTVPIIQAMRERSYQYLDSVEESLYRKLPHLEKSERKVIGKHLKSIINYMVKEPIKRINELPGEPHSAEKLSYTKELFDLKEVKTAHSKKDNQRIIKVGTRASKLAIRQTQMVIDALLEKMPSKQFEIVTISTKGDRDQKSTIKQIGGKGVFVKEIERALISGEIDFAVHSFKDIQTIIADETTIAAVPKRAAANDVILMNGVNSLADLPEDAKVGTGSMRRRIQLQKRYPKFEFVELRGNIDTRIQKMYDQGLDAIVLAEAGLKRMDYFSAPDFPNYQILAIDEMVPSVGQGALALQCRKDDQDLIDTLRAVHHQKTSICVAAERQYLRRFGVDCRYPIGAYADFLHDSSMKITGVLGSESLSEMHKEVVTQSHINEVDLGNELYQQMAKHNILSGGSHE